MALPVPKPSLHQHSLPRAVCFGHVQLPFLKHDKTKGFPWQLGATKAESAKLTTNFSGTWVKVLA